MYVPVQGCTSDDEGLKIFLSSGMIAVACIDQNENPKNIPRIPPTSDMKVITVYFKDSSNF